MDQTDQGKLLAHAEGSSLAGLAFVALIVCGVLLFLVGAFLVGLEIFEAAQDPDGLIVFYLFEGVLFAALGGFILLFAVPFRDRATTSLHIYDSHVMAKWLLAKQAVRVEYSQIVDIKVKTGGRRIDLQLGPPFDASAFSALVVFRVDDRNAQSLCDILRERKELDKKPAL